MGITFRCEHCGKEVQAPDEAGGRRGKCPFCKQSNYIPSKVSEEDLIPLAPIDEDSERQHAEFVRHLMEQERELRVESAGEVGTTPLEDEEGLGSEDLHHFVVNYCLDMSGGHVERAEIHAAQLEKFGAKGLQAVDDFIMGKVLEPALDMIPRKDLQRYLVELQKHLG